MTTRTPRRSKALGAAIAAATLSTSFIAFAPTAGAELLAGADGGNGDIRVHPTDPAEDNTDQPAPVIFAGEDGQAGADIQIVLNNLWAENDRILLAVTDSDGANCVGADGAVAYSAAPALAVAGPFTAGSLATADPGAGDPADAAPTEEGIAPTFDVSLLSSDGCTGVTDLIELRLTNNSIANEAAETHEWVLTLSDIGYDVGADVPAGPIHNAPYGEAAVPAEEGGEITWEVAPDTYGGNAFPGTTNRWTNGAFVSPVDATVGAPNQLFVGAGDQGLGSVTVSETEADTFRADGTDDTLVLTFGNLAAMDAAPDPVVTIADKDDAEASATVDGNEVTVTYSIPAAGDSVLGDIEITGLRGTPVAAGPVDLSIDSPHLTSEFLTADDQTDGDSAISDVNPGNPVVVEQVANALTAVSRIGGINRYATSAQLALLSGCTDVAIVASGEDFADALSANYLAGALSVEQGSPVPVVLTRAGSLPAETSGILSFLGVNSVYVVGGPTAVSPAVFSALGGSSVTDCGGTGVDPETTLDVTRLDGINRYETNSEVIDFASGLFEGGDDRSVVQLHFGETVEPVEGEPEVVAEVEAPKRTALLATGTNFADALTAGPLAASNFPLILTTPGSLSTQAAATIADLGIEQVIILGGTSAVSAATQAEVEALEVSTFRFAGVNRFETATLIADFARTPAGPPTVDTAGDYDAGMGYSSPIALLTQATNYADALAGGSFAGQAGANIVLTHPASLHPTTQAWLTANADGLGAVVALGQTAAVSAAALAAATAAIG